MGEQYTYEEINRILCQYQRKYKRSWKRADYMACWKKVKHGVEMRVGWHCTGYVNRHQRGERLMLLYPDGRVTISANLRYPYERTRLNNYFPFRDKWQAWWWRGLILSRKSGDLQDGYVISPLTRQVGDKWHSRYIEFDSNGEIISSVKDMMRFKQHKKLMIKEANDRAKPRKRGWYWTRRARNIYQNRSKCVSRTPWSERDHSPIGYRRYYCQAGQWQRQPPQTYSCGCVTYRKTYKRPFRQTVHNILDEQNATVRSAWIQIYGVQKFFEDAGAKEVHKRDNYRLLRLETGDDENREERAIMALKMICPSTGTIYINAVPDNVGTVENALNWIYNVRDYFGTVGAQT